MKERNSKNSPTHKFDRSGATGVISEEYGIDYSNYDAPGHISISATQIDRIIPTTRIRRGANTIPLSYSKQNLDLSKISITDPVTNCTVDLDQFLCGRLHNDGLLILHKNEVIHESYRCSFGEADLHINFSTTKSLVGMLTGIAIERALIDPEAPIGRYVPELQQKNAWEDVTVRHVMDMRDGIEFEEDYANRQSMFWVYVRSVEPFRTLSDDPKGFRHWLSQNLNTRKSPAGEKFQYSSVQTCVLACALETVFKQTIDKIFEKELFQAVGPESDAGFGHDGYGFHLADGILSMTLRDFSRIACLVLNFGRNLDGVQVVPKEFFRDLITADRDLKAAFLDHKDRYPEGQYRSQFWVIDPAQQQIAMTGIHGQFAYVDYRNELAIVGYSAYPVATDWIMKDSLNALWQALTNGVTQKIS